MSSFDDVTLADLQGLVKNLSVASYGTKGDIIGRLVQHTAGPSMLKTLDDKAKAAKAAKASKKEEKAAANKKGGEFVVKEKLSAKFCKEFGIQYMSQSTKDGVTTYTYTYLAGNAGKRKSEDGDAPAKKKKKAVDHDEEEDEEEDEDEGVSAETSLGPLLGPRLRGGLCAQRPREEWAAQQRRSDNGG